MPDRTAPGPAETADSFSLADAVGLFSEQSSKINNLWAVFVAATFSAAGFGLTAVLPTAGKLSITIGFLAFAVGHLSLLQVAIRLQNVLSKEIHAEISACRTKFSETIRTLIEHRSTIPIALMAHVVIDVCVVILIWNRLPPGLGGSSTH